MPQRRLIHGPRLRRPKYSGTGEEDRPVQRRAAASVRGTEALLAEEALLEAEAEARAQLAAAEPDPAPEPNDPSEAPVDEPEPEPT